MVRLTSPPHRAEAVTSHLAVFFGRTVTTLFPRYYEVASAAQAPFEVLRVPERLDFEFLLQKCKRCSNIADSGRFRLFVVADTFQSASKYCKQIYEFRGDLPDGLASIECVTRAPNNIRNLHDLPANTYLVNLDQGACHLTDQETSKQLLQLLQMLALTLPSSTNFGLDSFRQAGCGRLIVTAIESVSLKGIEEQVGEETQLATFRDVWPQISKRAIESLKRIKKHISCEQSLPKTLGTGIMQRLAWYGSTASDLAELIVALSPCPELAREFKLIATHIEAYQSRIDSSSSVLPQEIIDEFPLPVLDQSVKLDTTREGKLLKKRLAAFKADRILELRRSAREHLIRKHRAWSPANLSETGRLNVFSRYLNLRLEGQAADEFIVLPPDIASDVRQEKWNVPEIAYLSVVEVKA